MKWTWFVGVWGCLAVGLVSVADVSAQTRKQEVRAAPGVSTVTLYTSKTRDKVLRQVPAQQIAGVHNVDSSSATAISIKLGKETVWIDTFDVVLSEPGKAKGKEECVVLSKGLKSDQSSTALNNDCKPNR